MHRYTITYTYVWAIGTPHLNTISDSDIVYGVIFFFNFFMGSTYDLRAWYNRVTFPVYVNLFYDRLYLEFESINWL